MAGKSRSESREAKNEIDFPISTSATATAASSSSAPPPKHLVDLNEDAVIEILQRLDVEVILTTMQFVSKKWGEICKQPDLWRVLDLKNEGYGLVNEEKRFERMCYYVVDLSQGQLIDLSIANHGEDNLLAYITDRSRRLRRRLKLLDYDITESALIEALQKLPELEELHLIMMMPLHATDIEAIGTTCPLLKSFTYNSHWQFTVDYAQPNSSDIALAIAKTMPKLRHLSLFADLMKNEGLKAILDGCPHLESLDLRRCSNLDLEGDLGKRLCERIKDVRLPSDSTSDIEWPIEPPEPFLEYGSESQSSFTGETDEEMVDVEEYGDGMFED